MGFEIHDAGQHRGDLGDRAAGHAAMAADPALLQVREAAARPIETSAACLNCGDPTTAGARWCGPDCRDDWVKRRGLEQC